MDNPYNRVEFDPSATQFIVLCQSHARGNLYPTRSAFAHYEDAVRYAQAFSEKGWRTVVALTDPQPLAPE